MRDFVGTDAVLLDLAIRKRRPPRRVALGVTAAAALVVGALAIRYASPVAATAYPVVAGDVTVTLSAPGELEALRRTAVSATVRERVADIGVDVGDAVSGGQIVARLDRDDALLGHDRAVLEARALLAQRDEAQARLRREAAALDNAAREHGRQAALQARGVASDGALDAKQAEELMAAARVAEAEARLRALDAEIEGAARAVALRADDVRRRALVAPFGGVVVARLRESGDVVSPGEPVLEIVDPASVVLTARFDESVLGRLAADQTGAVTFSAEPGRAHAAAILRIDREVDPETREATARLRLASLPTNWALGQRGRVDLEVATRADALTVPVAALRHRDGDTGVWVLRDGRAVWRPVRFGESIGDRVIVEAGLADGDVALDGATLFPRARVEVAP